MARGSVPSRACAHEPIHRGGVVIDFFLNGDLGCGFISCIGVDSVLQQVEAKNETGHTPRHNSIASLVPPASCLCHNVKPCSVMFTYVHLVLRFCRLH